MGNMMKTKSWIALAVAAALPLAGCSGDNTEASASPGLGGSWSEIVERANEEGAVTWYSGMDEPSLRMIESAFEEEYPEIDVNIVRLNSSELSPRVDAERSTQSAGADVVHTSTHGILDDILSDGHLAEIQSPAYDELLNTTFKDNPGLAVDHWYAPFSSGAFTIAWNTDRVSEPIEGYADLIDRADEFNGQIAIPDMYGDVVAGYYLAIQRGLEGPESTDPTESDTLSTLAGMNPRLFDSVVPITNAVAAGEVKAGIYTTSTVYEALKEQGAPIEGLDATDLDASYGVNANVAIASWASNPNAAQVLVDFLFSKEGQAATATTGYSTVRTDVENPNGDIAAVAVPMAEMDDPAFVNDYRTNWVELFRS